MPETTPSPNELSQTDWDLVVVGGGSAGFFGAISAAEAAEGLGTSLKILILEKSSNVLGKVKISGGGRCNVTHACFDPKDFSTHYPRGEKTLIGPLHKWGVEDTVSWFESRGVELKIEKDGRMFPTTDRSQSIIDCLTKSARDAGIKVATRVNVESVQQQRSATGVRFSINCVSGGDSSTVRTRNLLLATGGTRATAGERIAKSLGHSPSPPVPSLFTFQVDDSRLENLQGVSVSRVSLQVAGEKLSAEGPLLVTHWGLSGPAILRLSAWGARILHSLNYDFEIIVNWLPGIEVSKRIEQIRVEWTNRSVTKRSPFESISKRLWERLAMSSGIEAGSNWSQVSKKAQRALTEVLQGSRFQVKGKSLNKDEFVTCGGVPVKEVDFRTMQSKLTEGLYFAGEVLDVDGITGGFNFQNAWTTGYLAGNAIAMQAQE